MVGQVALADFGDQQLGLRFTGSYVQNWGGANEKWMQSTSGTWHFITPDGTLYRWTGAPAGAGFLSNSVAIAILEFIRRQARIAARQIGIFDRLKEISEAPANGDHDSIKAARMPMQTFEKSSR